MDRIDRNSAGPGADDGQPAAPDIRQLPGSTLTLTSREADGATDRGTPVQPLNEAAALYEALADEIRGRAVGWSPNSLALLERGLLERYGPVVGGRASVRRLVRLAAHPQAA